VKAALRSWNVLPRRVPALLEIVRGDAWPEPCPFVSIGPSSRGTAERWCTANGPAEGRDRQRTPTRRRAGPRAFVEAMDAGDLAWRARADGPMRRRLDAGAVAPRPVVSPVRHGGSESCSPGRTWTTSSSGSISTSVVERVEHRTADSTGSDVKRVVHGSTVAALVARVDVKRTRL